MPIEIRELIIKATVQQDTGSPGKPTPAPAQNNGVGQNETMIQTCIDRITEIIKTQHER